MMIYLSGLVGFLLLLTAEARVGNSSQSEFCSETEQCLLFERICVTEEYEVRLYRSVKWVSAEQTSYFMEFAMWPLFSKLFKYISGGNENETKIEMTAPVIIKISEDKSSWSFMKKNIYTMSFLLPAEHQAIPPKPTDPKVYIKEMPDVTVYVRAYTGWMTSFSHKREASSLSSALDLVGAEYDKDYHYAVGYNSPMKMTDRHNEVWYVVQDEPVCSSSEEM